MVRIIKIDGLNSFFMDQKTEEIQEFFDPENPNLMLTMKLEDNSILNVLPDKLHKENGRIVFDYGPDRFIIDDGHQNTLIRAGYIVLNDYDYIRITNKEKGVFVREKLLQDIHKSLSDLSCKYFDKYSSVYTTSYNGYQYQVYIDTNNSIVNKNLKRRDESLPFYPFIKTMDKYGTIYLSIFCKKEITNNDPDSNTRFEIGDQIIEDLINKLNNNESGDMYKFTRVIVKKKIILDD